MTTNDLEEVKLELQAHVVSLLETVVAGLNGHINLLEERVESQDKIIGILTAAYGELTAMIQALVARVGNGSEEEIAAFHRDVNEGKKQLVNLLKSFSDIPDVDGNA